MCISSQDGAPQTSAICAFRHIIFLAPLSKEVFEDREIFSGDKITMSSKYAGCHDEFRAPTDMQGNSYNG